MTASILGAIRVADQGRELVRPSCCGQGIPDGFLPSQLLCQAVVHVSPPAKPGGSIRGVVVVAVDGELRIDHLPKIGLVEIREHVRHVDGSFSLPCLPAAFPCKAFENELLVKVELFFLNTCCRIAERTPLVLRVCWPSVTTEPLCLLGSQLLEAGSMLVHHF
jgi:hypothetical protein